MAITISHRNQNIRRSPCLRAPQPGRWRHGPHRWSEVARQVSGGVVFPLQKNLGFIAEMRQPSYKSIAKTTSHRPQPIHPALRHTSQGRFAKWLHGRNPAERRRTTQEVWGVDNRECMFYSSKHKCSGRTCQKENAWKREAPPQRGWGHLAVGHPKYRFKRTPFVGGEGGAGVHASAPAPFICQQRRNAGYTTCGPTSPTRREHNDPSIRERQHHRRPGGLHGAGPRPRSAPGRGP